MWKIFLNVVLVDKRLLLSNFFVNVNFLFVVKARVKIVDIIIFAQMKVKHSYDKKYTSMYIQEKDYALIRLYYNYDIFFIVVLKFKYNQQYANFFRVLKRVKKLTYWLNLFFYWRIYLMLFVAQLKFVSLFDDDSFYRLKSD